MARQTVNMLWVLVVSSSMCCISFQAGVHADWTYSTNPADYDFGWLVTGTYSPGVVAPCTWCISALDLDPGYYPTAADQEQGYYWNHTVSTYRCDGVEPNESWAYHEPTRTIVFGNFTQDSTQVLCIDAVDFNSLGGDLLKLRYCNSSSVSQQWIKNGSRLISALPGPEGEELFIVLVSMYVSKTNVSTTQISLRSSVPSSILNYSCTDDFTFLSRNGFVDNSTNRFTTKGLLAVTNYSVDTIANEGFERSTISSGPSVTPTDGQMAQPSYLIFCGWVVDYGPVDYAGNEMLPAYEGSHSLHLNTYQGAPYWGQVSQTIETEAGTEYRLSFYFNGFPPNANQGLRRPVCNSTLAQMEVRVANSTSIGKSLETLLSDGHDLLQNFSMNLSAIERHTNFFSFWQPHSISFTASANVTTFSFKSLNVNTSCGPMIDYVTLVRLKPKQFWQNAAFQVTVGCAAGVVLLLGILAGGYFGRGRLCLPKDYSSFSLGLYKRFCLPEDYSGLYKTDNARVFTVKELRAATKNFSAVLGEGGFGTVYRAEFPDGTTGAVKVEKLTDHFRSSKVKASEEVAVLLRVHHRNLVNLTGFCIHRGRHMLVFEFLPNGSLHDRLHQSVIPLQSRLQSGNVMDSIELRRLYAKVLPWERRTKIAFDVAYGLEYLHHEADPPIVHRDVKSQNVLLTATDSAKLADFGLSKAAPPDAAAFESIETLVRGSIGYLDPQYFTTGVFSAKSDVYSYGVVLLELISGHQAIYNAAPLSTWAAPHITSPSLYHELVDKKLKGNYDPDELESLVNLSKMCMQEDSRTRPNMLQVVAFLNAKGLVIPRGESKDEATETGTLSREAYHRMHQLLIDSEAESRTGSADCTFNFPRPTVAWTNSLHSSVLSQTQSEKACWEKYVDDHLQ